MVGALKEDQRASFEDFLLFLESRPDEERWELNDGTAERLPLPTWRHQRIVANLLVVLSDVRRREHRRWMVLPGAGIHVPPLGPNATVPDIVVTAGPLPEGSFGAEPLVLIEVLSRSTRANDLGWKARYYRRIPSLAAYVVVHQDLVRVEIETRAGGWRRERVAETAGAVAIEALGCAIPFTTIYAETGVGPTGPAE